MSEYTLSVGNNKYLKSNNEIGFSVVGVLVSIVILSITLSVMFALFSRGLTISSWARHRLKALHYGTGMINQATQMIKNNFDVTDLEVINALQAMYKGTQNAGAFTIKDGFYTSTVNITSKNYFGEVGKVNCKDINLKIEWTERNGLQKAIDLNTSVYRTD